MFSESFPVAKFQKELNVGFDGVETRSTEVFLGCNYVGSVDNPDSTFQVNRWSDE